MPKLILMPVIAIYKTFFTCIIMDFIKSEMEKEFSSIGFRNQRRNLRKLDQVGKTNISRDKKRTALMPGKRVSAAGKVYWETRKNRSDMPDSKI